MQIQKERDTTLDIAKGISILLMTISHLHLFNNYPIIKELNTYVLTLFKMPLFIFISGILFSTRSNFTDFFRSKLDSLVKPTIIFCIILLLLYTSYYSLYENFSINTVKKSFTEAYIVSGPLWFPLVLFITLVIFKLFIDLIKKLDRTKFLIVTISLFTILALATQFNVGLGHLRLNAIFYFFIIFCLAYIIKNKNLYPQLINTHFLIFSMIGFSIIVSLRDKIDIKLDFYGNIFGNFPITSIAFVLGIILVLNISKLISTSKYISQPFILCSKASFFILALHWTLGNNIIYPIINSYSSYILFNDILTFLTTVILSIVLYKLTFYTYYLKYLLLPIKILNKKQI